MRANGFRYLLLAMSLALCRAAVAAEGSVTITSPQEGAKLDAKARHTLSYEVTPGPEGDHVHLYIDGEEVAVLRRLKGSHELGGLGRGGREICVKVVNKGHAPIGVERCVKVTLE